MPGWRYTEDQLREAVASSRSISEALRKLGVVGQGGNHERFRKRCADLGIDITHFMHGRESARWGSISHLEFVRVVANSRSVSETLRTLGLVVGNSNRRAFDMNVKRWKVDTSHFTGGRWNAGMRFPGRGERPLEALLVVGNLYQTSKLKARLIREGLKENRCEECGVVDWQDKPLTLELDHINGLRDDNRLLNLRLLCPNCHSQTENFRGRNIGRSQGLRQLRML